MLVRYLNLVALLVAGIWFGHVRSWESAVTCLGLLAVFVAHDLKLPSQADKASTVQACAHDRALFHRFLDALPTEGAISFIRDHDMGGSFKLDRLVQLRSFVSEWGDAERQFADRHIERNRKKLRALCGEYLDLLAANSWTGEHGIATVPSEWRYEQPARHREVTRKLHWLADRAFSVHQSLIRRGYAKFGEPERG